MTTRRWIATVAILGCCLGLDVIRRRKAEYSSRADFHATQYRERLGRLFSGLYGMHMGKAWTLPGPAEAALIRYHSEMATKYAHAARRPWLAIEPDPPEPE
jgi:hypothetical protein